MNIYEMLKEHLPKEKVWNQITGRDGNMKTEGYNQAREEFIDVLKRAKIDERQLSIILVDVFGKNIGHVHPDKFFNKLNETNILRIDDEK